MINLKFFNETTYQVLIKNYNKLHVHQVQKIEPENFKKIISTNLGKFTLINFIYTKWKKFNQKTIMYAKWKKLI